MDYFLKKYKEICKSEFSKYGFKSYRNNHYRVINDVFQSFNLHRSISGIKCTVEFTILPLCNDYKIDKTTCGPNHLKEFERAYEWFPYNVNSEESINASILEIVRYMHKFLMPYFERGNNCSNAYHEIRSFEKMLYQSETIAIYSSIKSCLALKMGEYDLAVKHLREIEEQWQDVYQDRVLRGTLTQEYVTKKEKDFKKLQEKIKHISERDMDYISDFIRTKEQNSLKNLGLNKI